MPRKKTASQPATTPRIVLSTEPATADPVSVQTPDEPTTAPVISRTAKTIQPLASTVAVADVVDTADTPEASEPVQPEQTAATKDIESSGNAIPVRRVATPAKPAPAETTSDVVPTESVPAKPLQTDTSAKPVDEPALTDADQVSVKTGDTAIDNEAALAAELAAAEKRSQELEALITSEKYFVPINAVQRKRSRKLLICLLMLLIVGGVVIVDALADASIIQLPAGVPHTHFIKL